MAISFKTPSLKKMKQDRVAQLMELFAREEGLTEAPLDGVKFAKEIQHKTRCPAIYEPSIIIVGQGRKRGYVGNEVYTYDANHYLVLSVSLPAECEIIATPEKPMICMVIDVDMTMLGELLLEMGDHIPVATDEIRPGIAASPLTEKMQDAVIRLLECMKNPADLRVLGRQIVREIVYLVLCGERGVALREVAARHSRSGQISKALKRIHQSYGETLDIQTLAREVGMSVSAFHHNFKAVTCSSPLQYIKNVRLHKARLLIAHEGFNASSAALRVGYESASQFNREFKRLFGHTPASSVGKLKAA